MHDLERSPVTIVGPQLPKHIELAELLEVLNRLTPWLDSPHFFVSADVEPALIDAVDALCRASVWLPGPHKRRSDSSVRRLLRQCVLLRAAIPGRTAHIPLRDEPGNVAIECRELIRQIKLTYSGVVPAAKPDCQSSATGMEKRRDKKLSVNERFGDLVKEKHEATDWTSRQIAKELGCSHSAVTETEMWKTLERERGYRPPGRPSGDRTKRR